MMIFGSLVPMSTHAPNKYFKFAQVGSIGREVYILISIKFLNCPQTGCGNTVTLASL